MKPKAPPVLVFFVSGLAMWGANAVLPGLSIAFAGSRLVALILAVAGVAVAVAGASVFARAGTTTDPLNPNRASRLVTYGIYRYTRNPMYLGLATVLAAWALYLANGASLALVLAFVGYMTRFQIRLEEQALLTVFGDDYASYKASVRRWL